MHRTAIRRVTPVESSLDESANRRAYRPTPGSQPATPIGINNADILVLEECSRPHPVSREAPQSRAKLFRAFLHVTNIQVGRRSMRLISLVKRRCRGIIMHILLTLCFHGRSSRKLFCRDANKYFDLPAFLEVDVQIPLEPTKEYTPSSMALRPTRPSWLFEEHRLEALIEQNDLTIPLSALRASRNECKLVDEVLKRILSEQNIQTMPGEFEMYWAKTHLAMDIQSILKRWCSAGWDKTWEGSALRNLCPEVPKQPEDRNMDDATTNTTNTTTTTTTTIAPTDTAVEQKTRLLKSEPTHPRFSEPFAAGRQSSHSGWTPCNGSVARPLEAEAAASAAAARASSRVYPIPVQPATKRQCEDSDDYSARRVSRSKSVNFGDRTQFICPYHAQNANEHPECANKSFPNPRKLKEHVWRWLKPFKCPTCGEGFGREKTRAIHCDQRKTKCKSMPSTYEGSAEQRRDQKIESAKSTREMIEIFEEYEREKHTPRDSNSSPSSTNPHNQDKNSNNGDGSASDGCRQARGYRDNQNDRSSSPESQKTSSTGLSDGYSDNGDNYAIAKSNHTYMQPQQTSSARMGEGVSIDIDSRRDSVDSREQEREAEEAVGLGLNPRRGFDHLDSNNTQHSLSQDSFQYPLQQPLHDEDESRNLYLFPQISPVLSSSSDMDYSASNSPNTIINPGTLSTNLLSNVPEIVVTHPEPQAKSPTITRPSDTDPYTQQIAYYPNPTSCSPPSNGLYNHHHHQNFRRGGEEEEGSPGTEDVPYGLNSRGMGQGYAAASLISPGYGSFGPLHFRMKYG
ncbi:unnamed protein product [Tuber aestivum]|uniref:Uncharacterized protein n=1 Tax=Tuber aestivum TaxID=59557 RepID=A0A292PX61_9PEZI|nr:unnamed protein product [Tuber aestivum]